MSKTTQVRITAGRFQGEILTFAQRHGGVVLVTSDQRAEMLRIRKAGRRVVLSDGAVIVRDADAAAEQPWQVEHIERDADGHMVNHGTLLLTRTPRAAFVDGHDLVW